MPWSGGVYTRGYPSWTNDANSNLPISATKFDTEDNDFAAGLNNCLTIDGLNKPTASLNWTQQINLSRASDGQLASWARTGGSNNPSATLSVTDATTLITLLLNGTLQLNTGSQVPLNLNSTSGFGPAMQIQASGTTVLTAGSNKALTGGNLADAAITVNGTNALFLGANAIANLKVTSAAISALGPTAAAQVDVTPDTGTFTPTVTGFSGSPAASGAWYRVGKLMLLQMVISGTSNATGFSVSNLPAACQPPAQGVALTTFGGTDNGNSALLAEVVIAAASATVTFQLAKTNTVTNEVQAAAASWTASGTKGISFSVVYLLN